MKEDLSRKRDDVLLMYSIHNNQCEILEIVHRARHPSQCQYHQHPHTTQYTTHQEQCFFSGIFAHFFSFCFCHSLALKQNECLYGTFSISLNVRFLKILFCSCATKFVRICGQCVRAVAVLSVRVVAMREGDQAPYSRY